MLATSNAQLHDTVIGLVLVAIVALVVYVLCRLAGRPDWGAIGAAFVAIIGALLVLADNL